MKEKVYRCCIKSAILYGSEAWCLQEHENKRRTKRVVMRNMPGRKVVGTKTTEEKMNMLGSKETAFGSAKANRVRWDGQGRTQKFLKWVGAGHLTFKNSEQSTQCSKLCRSRQYT